MRKLQRVFAWISILSLILQIGSGAILSRPAFAEEEVTSNEEIEEVVPEEPVEEVSPELGEEEVSPEPVEGEPTLTVEQGETTEEEIEPEVEVSEEPELDFEEPETAEESAELNPSIATDKEDYAPEETVTITGEDFPPNTVLLIKVTRPDGSVVKGDGSFEEGSDEITTDADGKFIYLYQLDGIQGEYLVEVFQGGTVLASITFTDSNPSSVTFCHATPPATAANGWNLITTDGEAIITQGHDGHDADIIPSFQYCPSDHSLYTSDDPTKDCKKKISGNWKYTDYLDYLGKNLGDYFGGATGEQILENGCVIPDCGNEIVEPGEECDEGELNGIPCQPEYGNSCEYCSNTCELVPVEGGFCGDDVLDESYEECDDGNNVDGDGCSANCTTEEEICVEGPTWASEVVGYSQGLKKDGNPITDPARTDPDKTLGVNDDVFYSLGYGGWLILTFDGWIIDAGGDDLSFHEVTWGRDSYPLEKALVEVSQDGVNWYGSWEVTNKDGGDGIGYVDFSSTGLPWIRFVRITDTTDDPAHSSSADGYDLDAVDATEQVCEEPQPEPYCGDGIKNGSEECDGEDGVTPGENFCTYLCQLVPIYDGEHTCPANTVPVQVGGPYQVYGNDADGINVPITAGQGYLFEALGTFIPTSAPGYLSDAGYTVINGSVSSQYGIHGTGSDYAAHALLADLGSGVGVVDWGNYNSDHIYTKYYEPATSLVQFLIGDRYDDWFNTSWNNQGGMGDNSGNLTLNVYECQPSPATIKAYKVVCDSEIYLPNWGNHGSAIGATTAQDYVDNSSGHCQLVEDWKFQYGPAGAGSFGSFQTETDEKGGVWQTFNVNSDAVINDLSGMGGRFEVREVFPSNDYVGFSNDPGSVGDSISAEFYCAGDVYNYDNWEWINSPQLDQTYYCVAFNAPQTSEVEVCKYDGNENPLSDWTIVLKGDYLETVNVPSDGSTIFSSSLTAGDYVLEPIGTYTYWPAQLPDAGVADAGYSLRPEGSYNPGPGPQWINGDALPSPWTGYLEIQVDGANVDWGYLTTDHRYGLGLSHPGGTISFNILDSNYGDNSGNIPVGIYKGWVGQTGGDGCVTFSNVLYGEYTLEELIKAGWEQASGPGNPVLVDEPEESFNFHNREVPPPTGSISGHKWEDKNLNQVFDGSDEYLENWTINLWQGTYTSPPVGLPDQTTQTDVNGAYSFDNLTPGNYAVCETVKPGWAQYIPGSNDCYYYTVQAGGDITNADFLNYQLGLIQGRKYEDLNGNGSRQGGESYLNDWTIRLYRDDWTQLDEEITGHTGLIGQYRFEDLAIGTYYVCEVLKDGWLQTGPLLGGNRVANSSGAGDEGPVCWRVIINQSGQSRTSRLFGNQLGKLGLDLTKSNSVAGSTVTYTLTVTNNSEVMAHNVVVHDMLPAGFSYVSGSTSGASEPTISGHHLTWSLGTLDPHETIVITYDVDIGSSPCGIYPNIAFVLGTNRGICDPGICSPFYSDFAYSLVSIFGGFSTTTHIGGTVLGISTEKVLGAATGSETYWLVLALLMILAGISLILLSKKKAWLLKKMAGISKKISAISFLLLLITCFFIFAGSALAIDSLYIRVADLPEYLRTDNFKLYYTALERDGKAITVDCYVRKDGGFGWKTFGGVQTEPSGSCEVFGSDLDGDATYHFKAIATSVDGSTESNETFTTVDRVAPNGPGDYRKSREGATAYRIHWKNPGETDYGWTRIFASTEQNFTADDATKKADVGGGPNEEFDYLVTGLEPNQEYYFALQGFDKAGNGSGLSGDGGSVTYEETIVEITPTPGPAGEVVILPEEEGAEGEGTGGEILGEEALTPTEVPSEEKGLIEGEATQIGQINKGLLAAGAGIVLLLAGLGFYFYRQRTS